MDADVQERRDRLRRQRRRARMEATKHIRKKVGASRIRCPVRNVG